MVQLRAENERLQQEQAASVPGPSTMPPVSVEPLPAQFASSTSITERLIMVPHKRKCPVFGGRSGTRLEEWLEVVQACMRSHRLSPFDQTFFLFDHLEGEAREEIKYRPQAERGDPTKIIAVFREIYGCSDSYVALQEAFFSRPQQEGETRVLP